jgi:hypothetical protein
LAPQLAHLPEKLVSAQNFCLRKERKSMHDKSRLLYYNMQPATTAVQNKSTSSCITFEKCVGKYFIKAIAVPTLL